MVINMILSKRALVRTFVFIITLALLAEQALAVSSAAILMYHRFGESEHPSTNIRLDQFDAHLKTLRGGEFTVKPIEEIILKLGKGKKLPEKTIGISIDDAFLSVYQNAWPRLRNTKLPFTLFVATDPIDRNLPGYMTWEQIRELHRAGVTIGSQTASHPHMPRLTAEKITKELRKSNDRFKVELGFSPKMIAYPYGEYSLAVGAQTKKAGFVAGFGQHSGIIHDKSDFFYLPRFAFNETFGGVSRLKLAGRALPLKASDITPADPYLLVGKNPPAFGFTVNGIDSKELKKLNCYASSEGRLRIERLGETRFEVRMTKPFPVGRSRINCTMQENSRRWRWFGRQFFVPPN
ncbi:MAG: chitin deacetylase [Rhodospirillaceae bacterium]|nr:chitin deacetylase [Rhodospirillaceae bacterium]